MLYTLLIYQAEGVEDNHTDRQRREFTAAHGRLQERSKANKSFRVANQLMPGGATTTVRLRSGKFTVVDGPFAETKEQLIGIYVFECGSLDEAIDYAKEIPNAATGTIEVRPVAYFEGPPPV